MGLVGAASGLISPIATRSVKKDGVIGNPSFAVLIIVSGLLGLLYGFLVNWWSWPFLDYGNGISYDQTSSIVSNVSNYFRFYIRTSLWWDIWALLGNSIAMVLFGRHVIMALLPAREFLYPKIEFLEAEEITDQRVSN